MDNKGPRLVRSIAFDQPENCRPAGNASELKKGGEKQLCTREGGREMGRKARHHHLNFNEALAPSSFIESTSNRI